MADPTRKKPAAAGKAEPSGESAHVRLFLEVADALGYRGRDALAALAGVSPDTIDYWLRGESTRWKAGTLQGMVANLRARLAFLDGAAGGRAGPLHGLWVADGAGPVDLARRVDDLLDKSGSYVGHLALYFDVEGAQAWQSLLRQGEYGQDRWLDGAARLAETWLPRALCAARPPPGIDVVSLGSGEGLKDVRALAALLRACAAGAEPPWIAYLPVDVSLPLLVEAHRAASAVLAGRPHAGAFPMCDDFEEGPLHFCDALPSARAGGGRRLLLMLGNVFGNLRDEAAFVARQIPRLVRPGDWVWLEVGLRHRDPHDDPVVRAMGDPERSPAAAARMELIAGPVRRSFARRVRAAPDLRVAVQAVEDRSVAPVPGSYCIDHQVWFAPGSRGVSVLYSKRYDIDALVGWLRERGLVAREVGWVGAARGLLPDARAARPDEEVVAVHLLLHRT